VSLRNKNVLIISPENWGINHVSKHHYALELAKNNYVYYLNLPQKRDSNVGQVISESLHIVNYKSMFPGINYIPFSVRKVFQRIQADQIQKTIQKKLDIVWSFDPYRFQYLPLFRSTLNIYHPVDIHDTPIEKNIVNSCHVIFGSSDKILERFSYTNKPVLKVGHGLADHFLNPIIPIKSFIRRSKRLRVGLVGNLHYSYIDNNTLMKIIEINSHIDFYFIGPYEMSNLSRMRNNRLISLLRSMPNTFLLGSKSSKVLPSYFSGFDLFLICYTGKKNISELANPHKILEYLSTGKPIVSHYIDEYKSHRNIICMVDDNKDLADLFSHVINNLSKYNSPDIVKKRKTIAKNNTYKKQIEKIEKFLSNIANES